MSTHVFACYKQDLSNVPQPGELLLFKDAVLWNRLVKILRISTGERFILFNAKQHIELTAHERMVEEKRMVAGMVTEIHENAPLVSPITLYLPILKKDALEHTTYVAAQMGVQTVVPLITQKSAHDISQPRLEKIMIAACEQAKQFIPPEIKEVCPLSQVCTPQESLKICFDEQGQPLTQLVNRLGAKPTHISLTLGPEGGFTSDEKAILKKAGFIDYRLTSTVLRSREALTVGLGIIASILSPINTTQAAKV